MKHDSKLYPGITFSKAIMGKWQQIPKYLQKEIQKPIIKNTTNQSYNWQFERIGFTDQIWAITIANPTS